MSAFTVEKRKIDGADRYCVVLKAAVPGTIVHTGDEIAAQMMAAKVNEAITAAFDELKFDIIDCFNKVTNHED